MHHATPVPHQLGTALPPSQLAEAAGSQLCRAAPASGQVPQQRPARPIILRQQLHCRRPVWFVLAVLPAPEEARQRARRWGARAWGMLARCTWQASPAEPAVQAPCIAPLHSTHLNSSMPQTNTSPSSRCRKVEAARGRQPVPGSAAGLGCGQHALGDAASLPRPEPCRATHRTLAQLRCSALRSSSKPWPAHLDRFSAGELRGAAEGEG